MIRRFVFAMALCLVCTAPAMAAGKFAAANLAAVSAQSTMGQEAEKQLTSRFSNDRSQLETKGKTIQQKMEDLNKQAAALSESARNQRVQEIQKLQEELETQGQAYTQRLSQVQQALTVQMQDVLTEAAANLAKKGGYDLIVDTAAAIYAASAVDVTKAYTEEVDKVWKAKGGKFNLPN